MDITGRPKQAGARGGLLPHRGRHPAHGAGQEHQDDRLPPRRLRHPDRAQGQVPGRGLPRGLRRAAPKAGRRLLYLRDIAEIRRIYEDVPGKLYYVNGQPALTLGISMLGGENVVAEGMLVRIQAGIKAAAAARESVGKTIWALLGGTLIGILAFAPIGLSPDATGEFAGSPFWVILISLTLSWLTAILGLIPLLPDVFFENMAITIMAGLGFATVLTPIVVPTLYSFLFRVPVRGARSPEAAGEGGGGTPLTEGGAR